MILILRSSEGSYLKSYLVNFCMYVFHGILVAWSLQFYVLCALYVMISYERLSLCLPWTCFRGWGESLGGRRRNWICFFGWLLLRGSNAEKWGDHKKKKFFINNCVEAVISFKQKYQGVLKHVLALSTQQISSSSCSWCS